MNKVTVVDFDIDVSTPFPVSARVLWQGLGSKDDFSTWFKEQTNRARLVENADYLVFREKPENSKGGRPKIEYMLTVNAAEHLALMSNTEKGAQYRQVLIGIKNKYIAKQTEESTEVLSTKARIVLTDYLAVCALLKIPEHLAQIESVKATKRLTTVDFSPLLQLSATQDDIKETDAMLEPTEIGKVLELGSAIAVNRWLEDKGLQTKTDLGWVPTEAGKLHAVKHSWVKGSKSGYNIKWNVEFLKTLR